MMTMQPDDIARIVAEPEAFSVTQPQWFVWKTGNRNPKWAHATKEKAVKEAKRLATMNPKGTFIVMKSVTIVRAALKERG